MYTKDDIKEVVSEFENHLNQLANEYETNIQNILNSSNLTDKGKAAKEEEEYQVFEIANKNIRDQYNKKISEMIADRRKKAAAKLEELKDLKVSDELNSVDISYIEFIINNGLDDDLKKVAEKYNYNPYVLKMINLRDSDKSRDGFKIKNPLEDVLNESYIDYVGFSTQVINRRSKLWD